MSNDAALNAATAHSVDWQGASSNPMLSSADDTSEPIEVAAAATTGAVPYSDDANFRIEAAKVEVPEGAHVARIQVTPGETVELPFGLDDHFLAKLSDGNLAIKVGDVIVILEGYASASAQNPPVVETADGHPLDIAALLAATDPNSDIQTAAGPGGGATGQDNTGAILSPFDAGESGLGGFQSVGGQGDTQGPGGFGGTDEARENLNPQSFINTTPVASDLAVITDEDHPISGQLTATDADGDALTYHFVGAAPTGVTLASDGSWSFDPAGNYESLGSKDTAQVTFQFAANDGSTDSNTATATVTIQGVNDAPVITASLGSVVTFEDNTDHVVQLPGFATIVDPDSKSFTYAVDGTAPAGITLDPNGTLHVNPAGHYDYLAEGEQASFTLNYKVSDGEADSNVVPVTITVVGINDTASIAGDKSGSVTEDSGVAGTGTLTVTDADHDQSHTQAATNIAATYGTWSVDTDGHWSYAVDDSNSAVNALGDGGVLTDHFTVTSQDGTASQDVTVTIHGSDDAPVAAGGSIFGLTEDASGDTTVTPITSDVDTPAANLTYAADSPLPAGITLDSDGTIHIDYAGNYNFLAAGQEFDWTFNFKAFDGEKFSNDGVVSGTIIGVNDPASIAGDASGSVTEDSGVAAIGTLAVTDPDQGESHAQVQSGVAATYGTWSVDTDGHWNYAVDDSNSAVNALGDGGVLTDHFTVTSQDGTASQDVTITIHGHNDAPVAENAALEDVTEDTNAIGTLTLVASDAETPVANLTYTVVGSLPTGITLDPNGDVHASFAGHYDYLAAGETLGYSFQYQVSDGQASSDIATITGTIIGVNDAASIAGDKSGSVTEDSGVATTGTLVVTDADHDQSHAQAETNVAATYGTWSVDGDGHWSYKVDDSNSAVNALGDGGTLTDQFTVTSQDGTASQAVTVTIHGHTDVAPAIHARSLADATLSHVDPAPSTDTYFFTTDHAADSVFGTSGSADKIVVDGAVNHLDLALAGDNLEIQYGTDAFDNTIEVQHQTVAGQGIELLQFTGGLFAGTYHVVTADSGSHAVAGETGGVNYALVGGDGGVTLTGNDGSDLIFGGHGADTLNGGGGNDYLFAGPGADRLNGGGGNDYLFFGTATDGATFHGGKDGLDSHNGLMASAADRGDVLVLNQVVDLTDTHFAGKIDGIETISLLNAESGAKGAQTLTLDAHSVLAMSDHQIALGGAFDAHNAIRIDLDSPDELYLSNKDGGSWADIGISTHGYEVYAHDTGAGHDISAYAMVATADLSHVHVNQDVPAA